MSLLFLNSQSATAQAPGKGGAPQVEVVFCLDTTGSMAGLINSARMKIWSICNQISAGKPAPKLKVGIVAYRDRGDEYITKIVDLSEDLDSVHRQLLALKADGGGDEPEDVNKALYDSVQEISWSNDPNTLRMIFLVGDAPPHMDYGDQLQYPEICKMAVAKDIIINTIQCGNSAETRKYWVDIARLGEGSYVQIDGDDQPPMPFPPPPPPKGGLGGIKKKKTSPLRPPVTPAPAPVPVDDFRTPAPAPIPALPPSFSLDGRGSSGLGSISTTVLPMAPSSEVTALTTPSVPRRVPPVAFRATK